MKKLTLVLFLLPLFFDIQAQIDFIKATPQPNLVDVYGGSFASGDIDDDGDQDLIMAGITPGRVTALYFNDGNGNFTEQMNTPFPDAATTVAILEDLDSDGDLDFFFSGNGSGVQDFAHVYLNDGQGMFSLLNNPALPQFSDTGVAMADVDGDQDMDLLFCIQMPNGSFVSDIYLNDGNAIFTPANSNAFPSLSLASIAFIDAENDGDADVLISGKQSDDAPTTQLYLNDGNGNFAPDNNNTFLQLLADDIDVADTDNDGDLDVLLSGSTVDNQVKTLLYLNDGAGQFTALDNTNLQQTFGGTNAFADFDNDGDQDLVIIGSQDGGLPNIYNIVYENTSDNVFIPVDTIGGEYIAACIVDDFNGDALVDIIIQGFADDTNVYWNNSLLTSLQAPVAQPSLQVFPNPTAGSLTLRLDETDEAFQLSIYTLDGQRVLEQNERVSKHTTWQFALPVGTYLLVLRNEQIVLTEKLVIMK